VTSLPVYDLSTADGASQLDACLARLRASSSLDSKWLDIAAKLIDAVKRDGDDAVVQHMRDFGDPDFTADRIAVKESELARAEASLDADLRQALQRSIAHVREYQQHIMPAPAKPVTIDGAELGLRWTPIQPVGLLVPGASAVLFSTVIMLAVPAQVAGVKAERISLVHPPPYRKAGEPVGDISPVTLAVCHMLGVQQVYRIGGPAAVAALAFGTERIKPVNFIAGPGHPVVQAAKLQLRGVVGTDGFYGASEIVTIADESAKPARIAADLIAQAEHDPGKCFFVTWHRSVLDAVQREVNEQLKQRSRAEAVVRALRDESCAVLVRDVSEAAAVANRFAAEHVNLAVADPDALLSRIEHGGEFFLGDTTPVAAGDYYAGPSHTLPTGTTARFTSGVSVYTFLKRSGTVAYRNGMSERTIADIARLAEAEGLDGHAASVRVREQ
jgi:histidinol dehydrogenase